MQDSGLRPEMTTKRSPRPRDPAQLAKLIVDIAAGEVEDREPTPEDRAKTRLRFGGQSHQFCAVVAKGEAQWA
jgi:hypothetical protein